MKIQWEPFNFEYNKLDKTWDSVDEEEGYEDESGDEDLEALFEGLQPKKGTLISTPMGMFNVLDPFAPHTRFDMWIAHTDFNITKSFLSYLSKVEGIELVAPISRYSFLIGIGRLFNFRDIRFKIEFESGVHDETMPEVKAAVENLKNQNLNYFVHVYPDGTFDYSSQSDSDFQLKLKKALKDRENGHGSLLRG